jgi:hypothetical protein
MKPFVYLSLLISVAACNANQKSESKVSTGKYRACYQGHLKRCIQLTGANPNSFDTCGESQFPFEAMDSCPEVSEDSEKIIGICTNLSGSKDEIDIYFYKSHLTENVDEARKACEAGQKNYNGKFREPTR